MDVSYAELARNLRARKRLGQNFLVNESVARIEAEYARGKFAVEIGPGLGILTRALSKASKRVLAVEKDRRLYELLSNSIDAGNVMLLEGDFFDTAESAFAGAEIMVSNVPYNLSSKVLSWLMVHRLEAVLCLQKEFVEHMLAKPGTKKYSKLSVFSALQFSATRIMDVPRNNFYPVPKVDSVLVHLEAKGARIDNTVQKVLGLVMEHKKKLLRNAVIDSAKSLLLDGADAVRLADSLADSGKRVFKMGPEELLAAAEDIASRLTA